MLQRVQHANGIVTYQSPLLRAVGVPHGFATRVGGISKPPYDALNLGVLEKNAETDGNIYIAENYRRLRRALDLERHMRMEVRQVHGADVWAPTPGKRPVRLADAPCADAIVTNEAGRMLTIRTADCVPILMASRDGKVVAAIHAGWRGVVAKVVEATFAEFDRHYHIGPEEWIAAIGPCISAEHFEVGTDVAIAFADAGLQQAIVETDTKPRIDLAEAVHHQLRHLGVPAESIDRCDRCTYRDEAEFYSHRRDVTHRGKPDTGRMAAVIAAK